jgi:hypothetical protein
VIGVVVVVADKSTSSLTVDRVVEVRMAVLLADPSLLFLR